MIAGKGSKLRDLPERFGEALKHAGVGVTITSTTDIIVFLVGGTTVNKIHLKLSFEILSGIIQLLLLLQLGSPKSAFIFHLHRNWNCCNLFSSNNFLYQLLVPRPGKSSHSCEYKKKISKNIK